LLVTPDGERTLNTYLGAAQDLHPRDNRRRGDRRVQRSPISEGYLVGTPKHAQGRLPEGGRGPRTRRSASLRLTLSDAFCVDRWRDEFLDLNAFPATVDPPVRERS